ncbi:MAG: DUF1778 domain-containing protein [Chloroflexota bacterium]|nr:DUF1778 domain-containing protein [Chloroflexota bacterium]MDQ6906001.1 DUF1778 domain-containing protein [Chloroflexota bacterium]
MSTTTEKPQTNQSAQRTKRTDRVDLRVDPAVKQRWQHAADLLGVPLASFVTMATAERADQTIRDQEMLVLTPEESEWFINYLAQETWEPSPALLRAAERHRELFGDDPT